MYDVGIAEQHAVTFAAGLACEGLVPFCAIYSTFLQRGYDQVVHDVSLQSLPVRFAMDRAGLVGADGATHCGAFDVTYMACLPNMVVMAPSNEAELINMVATAAAIDDRPSCFRFPRGNGVGIDLSKEGISQDLKGTPMEVRRDECMCLYCDNVFFILHTLIVGSQYDLQRLLERMMIVQVGKGVVRRSGKDVAIVGYGHSVVECLAAAEVLENVRCSR